MSPRYAKGEATRALILKRALALYGAAGAKRPTLKALAAECGMAEGSVMHYFANLDELFVEVLKARDGDAVDSYRLTDPDGVWEYLTATTKTPGLTRLFVEMSAFACDPSHPASTFFVTHRRRAASVVATAFGLHDPADARVLIAAAEGLQMQWLLDPSIDIVAELKRVTQALLSAHDQSSAQVRTSISS